MSSVWFNIVSVDILPAVYDYEGFAKKKQESANICQERKYYLKYSLAFIEAEYAVAVVELQFKIV